MERIEVPFLKKNRAVELGAIFSKAERKWYIPDELDTDRKEKLRYLSQESFSETDTSGHSYKINQYSDLFEQEHTSCNPDADNREAPVSFSITEGVSTLEVALKVYQNGMPSKEEDRILVLKALGQRSPDQYPITYDGMLLCSPDFARRYPQELIAALCKRCITGARSYIEEIRMADISQEEKALLLFALPM